MRKIYTIMVIAFALIGLSAMAQTAYITNSDAVGTVSVINLVTNTVVATIPVANSPFGVCALPNGSKVYITNQGSDTLSVINPVTNTVSNSIIVGSGASGVACSPDGRKIYVANTNGELKVINTNNDSIIATISIQNTCNVTVSPDGSKIYLVSPYTENVYVIDTVTNTVVDSTWVGAYQNSFPYYTAITPDGSKLYVSNIWNNYLFVINTATNLITDTIDLGNCSSFLCISPDGTTLYVSVDSGTTNYLGIINIATNTITALIPTPWQTQVGGMEVSPDGSKLYFTDQDYHVYVMDRSTNLFIDAIEVWVDPVALGNFISPYITPLVCSTYFVIYADTLNQNHYIITDSITGFAPFHYLWSWGDGNYDSIPNPSHIYADTGIYTICLTITDTFGCQSTYCDTAFDISRLSDLMAYVDVLGSTGIPHILQRNNSLSLYPNPTTSLLTLSLPNTTQKATINLYDMLGEKVLPSYSTYLSQSTINLINLPQGIYFLEVLMDGEKQVRKVVKMN